MVWFLMCLGHEIWFFKFIFYTLISSFFLQSLKTVCYREKNLSRQPFGRKLKIWRLNPLFTLSFFFVSLRSHRSDFRNISEIKGIFLLHYFCFEEFRSLSAYVQVVSFFLLWRNFQLVGYWQILAIKRSIICLHGWVILKFFGKKNEN